MKSEARLKRAASKSAVKANARKHQENKNKVAYQRCKSRTGKWRGKTDDSYKPRNKQEKRSMLDFCIQLRIPWWCRTRPYVPPMKRHK